MTQSQELPIYGSRSSFADRPAPSRATTQSKSAFQQFNESANQPYRAPVRNLDPEGLRTPVRRSSVQERRSVTVFAIFIGMFITTALFLFACFFGGFCVLFNRWLLGIFKRPLPDNSAKYYDVNCINSMNLQDFINENQVERCREARPINRPGPPRRF